MFIPLYFYKILISFYSIMSSFVVMHTCYSGVNNRNKKVKIAVAIVQMISVQKLILCLW